MLDPVFSIWIPGIPSKVSFFIYNFFLDKILTLNNLRNRGQSLANRCILCLVEEEESIDHILIHCSLVREVWGFFLSLFKAFGVFLLRFFDFIYGWLIRGLVGILDSIWHFPPQKLGYGGLLLLYSALSA